MEVLLYDCTDAAREIAAETTAGTKRYITKAGALQIQVKRLAELKKKIAVEIRTFGLHI